MPIFINAHFLWHCHFKLHTVIRKIASSSSSCWNIVLVTQYKMLNAHNASLPIWYEIRYYLFCNSINGMLSLYSVLSYERYSIHTQRIYIYTVYVSRKKDLSTRLEQRSRYSSAMSACIPSLSIGTAVHATVCKLIWLICTYCTQPFWYCSACSLVSAVLQCMQTY